jgi:hypothetical protein
MANKPIQPKPPAKAPTQPAPVTGLGQRRPTGPTFNQSPTPPKPWPRGDNQMKIVVTDQRQPAPRGPRGNGA